MASAQRVNLNRWTPFDSKPFKVVKGPQLGVVNKDGDYVSVELPATEIKIPDLPSAKKPKLIQFKRFLGARVENPDFTHQMSTMLKVSEIPDEETRKAILRNASWLEERTREVVKLGYENIQNGKDPWHGIDGIEKNKRLPMSSDLMDLAGNKKRQQYNHHLLANQIAKAIILSIEQGVEVRFYFDVDGTIEDKTARSYLTRSRQPIEQIYLLYKLIEAFSQKLGVKICLNTNRAPGETVIGVEGYGLHTPRTYQRHTSPSQAVSGYSHERQLEMSRWVEINALSGGYSKKPGEWLKIPEGVILGCDTYKKLGDRFTDEFIRNPAEKYGFTVIEPKALSAFELNTIRLNGRVSGDWVNQILTLKEKIVDQGIGISMEDVVRKILWGQDIKGEDLSGKSKVERYVYFNNKLDEHLEEGDIEIPRLEAQIAAIEREIAALKSTDQDGSNNLKIKEREEELQETKIKLVSYIRLIGRDSDNDFLEYKDSFGEPQRCINYNKYRLNNPQSFVREITEKAEKAAVCIHNEDSRNIPHPEAVDDQILILNRLEEGDRDNPSLRKPIRHAHWLCAQYYTNEINNTDEYKEFTGKELKHPNSKIQEDFVDKGREIYKQEGPKGYLNWRLCKYLELRCSKESLSNSTIFDCSGDGISFKPEFLQRVETKTSNKSLDDYIDELKEEFEKSNGPERRLASYVESVYDEDYLEIARAKKHDESFPPLPDEYFFPDMFNCENNKVKYTGFDTLLSIFSLETKREPLIPWGQGRYSELFAIFLKKEFMPTVGQCLAKRKLLFSFGDTSSDLPSHNRALHSVIDINGVKMGGVAVQIYNNLGREHYLRRAINKRLDDVKRAKEGHYPDFARDYIGTGAFGLEKVDGSYRKIIDIDDDGTPISPDGKVYQEEEIRDEIWRKFLQPRICYAENPAANVYSLAEIARWLTGEDMSFDWSELEKAQKLNEEAKSGRSLTEDENKLVEQYSLPIEELERSKYRSSGATSFGVYFEYFDEPTGKKYYRMESDRRLATKDGEHFSGDEGSLTRRAIVEGIWRDEFGVYVYRDNNERFEDQEFLSKCYEEEEVLPPPSPIEGLFTRKGFLKVLGSGNVEKGQSRLRTFFTKLPNLFSSTLAWCGGLLSLGGIVRLGSKLFGGVESSVYSFGYWLSQSLRAASAFAGGLRGLLNVNGYYQITVGELINVFSALFAGNGPKHIGYAFGNLFLLSGRGIQSCQRQLSSNVLTKEEINANKPVEGIIDPRPFQAEVTRFCTEKIMLPIKRAVENAGLPTFFGHLIGSIAGTTLTTMYMLKQIAQNPKLIFQIKERVSDKSGNSCRTIPSTGHLFALSGVLSGIGAILAGTIGRTERFGEVSERGFNTLGRWALSFATSIQSLPIIANGLELAANQNGIPRITRGLDGKTIRYSPERAGYGQVFAGGMFGLLSWFDLSKDWAAALLDFLAIGPYFGVPKMRVSVAEEEKVNSLELAENMLFASDQYFLKKEKEEKLSPEVFKQQAQYQNAA